MNGLEGFQEDQCGGPELLETFFKPIMMCSLARHSIEITLNPYRLRITLIPSPFVVDTIDKN